MHETSLEKLKAISHSLGVETSPDLKAIKGLLDDIIRSEQMLTKISPSSGEAWLEFRSSGMLWYVNRLLHLFGYAIALQVEDDGRIISAEPQRCRYRGFDEEAEANGFRKMTGYLSDRISELKRDCYDYEDMDKEDIDNHE